MSAVCIKCRQVHRCWRCDGSGVINRTYDRSTGVWEADDCPECWNRYDHRRAVA